MTEGANIQGALHLPGYLGSANHQRRKRKRRVTKAESRTLYVHRPVRNGAALVEWAKAQGFPTTVPLDDLHVTIAFSRTPVDWFQFEPEYFSITIPAGPGRKLARLGDGSATVLRFESELLEARWQDFRDGGASWDWPSYSPHITLSWQAPDGIEATARPYEGPIVLGPEVFREVEENWKDQIVEKKLGAGATAEDYIDDFVNSDAPQFKGKSKEERIRMALGAFYAKKQLHHQPSTAEVSHWMKRYDQRNARIVKIDKSLGLVLGYAIICKIDGQPYYDLNIDPDGTRVPEHIPESAMLKAAADFMLHSRVGNEMHRGPDSGTYVFAFPMTEDIAKSLGIEAKMTGLLVAYKPPPDVFAKFASGEYTGFSIEGRRLAIEENDA